MDDDVILRMSEVLKAMADPTRIKILHSLRDREMRVSDVLDHVGGSQANLSKHLGVLRRAGLVRSRREGASVNYRIADPRVFNICSIVCDTIGERIDRESKLREGLKQFEASQE